MPGPLRTTRQAKLNDLFAGAAEKLDLTLEAAGPAKATPSIAGTVEGIEVAVTAAALWPLADRLFTAWFDPSVPKGSVSGRFPPGEGRVLRVGELGFETWILIRSNMRAEWTTYLTQERQDAIMAIRHRWLEFEISGGRLTATEMFAGNSRVTLVDHIRALVGFAQVLGGSGVQDTHRRVVADRLTGNEAHPWTLGDVRTGWAALAAGAAEAHVDRGRAEMASDVETAIMHLFGSRVPRAVADARFEAQWIDRIIRWSGTVVSAMPHVDSDALGPSSRVIATVGYVDGMHLISNRIEAVVDVIRPSPVRPGQRFGFEGRLASIDHPSRKLHVTAATQI